MVTELRQCYDGKAELYSYGMVLYLLMNEFHFPDSDGYQVNEKRQYLSGYCLPAARHGSDRLFAIVERLCRYAPEDRYPSMEEVFSEIEELYYGTEIADMRRRRKGLCVLGSVLFLSGVAAWKLKRVVPASNLFSVALIVLVAYEALKMEDRGLLGVFFQKKRYWRFLTIFYLLLFGFGLLWKFEPRELFLHMREIPVIGKTVVFWEGLAKRLPLISVGLTGMLFCTFFRAWEWCRAWVKKRRF